MKTPFEIIILFALFSCVANSQAPDSCIFSNITLIPLDTTAYHCQSVWDSQNFILRFVQNSPGQWVFILSAPNTNSYVAIGFSPSGSMVGSSAVVGWVSSDGTPIMHQYYLGGKKPKQVQLNQGKLNLSSNIDSFIVANSSRIYMTIILETNGRPDNQLLYAVGPEGRLPVSPDFELSEHNDKIVTMLNYASGKSIEKRSSYSKLKKSHGILNMLGWGIILPIGALVARHMKHKDPFWFYAHTTIQSLGFILGIVGVICGFVLNDRIKANVHKHRSLGIFILVLGCLQVIAFLGRPDKMSKVRKYWNIYHYIVGRILIIFAVVNVFIGICVGKAGTSWSLIYAFICLILIIVGIILEVKLRRKN